MDRWLDKRKGGGGKETWKYLLPSGELSFTFKVPVLSHPKFLI